MHERLTAHPHSGLRYRAVPGGYRVLLPRSRNHVYFRITDGYLEIFAVVGAVREHGPRG